MTVSKEELLAAAKQPDPRDQRIAALLEALEPFAASANEWDKAHEYIGEVMFVGAAFAPVTEKTSIGSKHNITVGDLRRARAVADKVKGGEG